MFKYHMNKFCPLPQPCTHSPLVSKSEVLSYAPPGLHKVKRCLQEFSDFFCACGKKHFSVLSHGTLSVIFTCFNALLYLPYSFLIVYLPFNVSFTTSNDYFGHCAWQTKDVPARKSCGLYRLWRSAEDNL